MSLSDIRQRLRAIALELNTVQTAAADLCYRYDGRDHHVVATVEALSETVDHLTDALVMIDVAAHV